MLQNNTTSNAGYTAKLRFSLSQSSRDINLIYKISDYFKGYVISSEARNIVELYITKYKAIKETLVPFLDKYKVRGVKALEYKSFREALGLMDDKVHLTVEGYDKLSSLKNGMNTGRRFMSTSRQLESGPRRGPDSRALRAPESSIFSTGLNSLNRLINLNSNGHLMILEYPEQQPGKLLLLRDQLSNSGEALKLLIPNLVEFYHGG